MLSAAIIRVHPPALSAAAQVKLSVLSLVGGALPRCWIRGTLLHYHMNGLATVHFHSVESNGNFGGVTTTVDCLQLHSRRQHALYLGPAPDVMTSSLALKLALAQFQRGPTDIPSGGGDAEDRRTVGGSVGRDQRPSLASSASTFTTSSLSLGPSTRASTHNASSISISAHQGEPQTTTSASAASQPPLQRGRAEEKGTSMPLEPSADEVLEVGSQPTSWRVAEFNRASEVFPHYLPTMVVLPYATVKERQAIPRR